jgi:hypothetical protein
MTKRVALVWRGEPSTPFEASGLPPIGRALQARGLEVKDAPFSEEAADDVRKQLFSVDAVLVWVDPISTRNGRNRSVLDQLLRDVAAQGIWVSAHPDAILKLGTKDILVRTKGMEWGSDCCLYRSEDELATRLPGRLREGAEVLKQHRGNGGDGVWKIEVADNDAAPGTDMMVRVLHARRGSALEELRLGDFVARCSPYFNGGGHMIGQPFQERLDEGQIRCYIVNGSVSGFGHHYIAGLLSPALGNAEPRNPRLYYGPSYPEFQAIKAKLEGGWIDEMVRVVGMQTDDLPVLWDLDLLYGPKNASGADTYILCEINASSVDIFPGETLTALADAVTERLTAPS